MSEQGKMIYADDLIEEICKHKGCFGTSEGNEPFMAWEVEDYINDAEPVDPEELPIVRELRAEIDMRVRDAKNNAEYMQYWINYAKEAEKKLVEAEKKLQDCEPKRGHWIKDSSGTVICSECGEEHEWEDFRAPYCDMCGAKMDEEV